MSSSVIISTPISRNRVWTFNIAFSFPGIFLLEKITESPFFNLIYLSASLEILFKAEFGSPWDPVEIIKTLDLGIKLRSFTDNKSGKLSKIPTSFAASIALNSALPIINTDLSDFLAISNSDLILLILEEKQVTNTIPFTLEIVSINPL